MDKPTTLIALPVPTEQDVALIVRCDSGVRFRRLLEIALVRKVCTELIGKGYKLSVDDGEDTPVKRSTDVEAIVDAAFAVDECRFYVHRDDAHIAMGWIFFVFGNSGWDSINDYTTNLEEALKGVNEYADALEQWV